MKTNRHRILPGASGIYHCSGAAVSAARAGVSPVKRFGGETPAETGGTPAPLPEQPVGGTVPSGWTRLLCIAALCVCGLDAHAAGKLSPLPKKPKADQESASDKSVEILAETARRSVVIVSHFGRNGREDGVGAGFVVSSNGLIATSLHVIGEARPIQVQLSDGQRFDVIEVHAWDRKLDLALIRIAATNLQALPLGDSDNLKQGTPVVAMGNPLGLEHSIVQGIVSAKRDFDGLEMIQLAIPIEPGNSGGPLLDMQGRVHGLLTMKSAITANLGFATPINALKPLLQKPNPVPMNRWLTIGALNPKEWTPVFGARWSQKASGIQAESPGTGFGGRSLCLAQKPVPERPYEVAVTVKLDDEAGAAGLVFASDGDQKHYGFYPSGGQLRLTRFDGPSVFTWTILKQIPTPAYKPGDWNTLKVRVEKEKTLCYVNGQLVAETSDQELTGGKVGLAKFRNTKAMFKGFQLGAKLTAAEAGPSTELIATIKKQIEEVATKPASEMIAALMPNADASQSILAECARKLESEAAQLRRLAVAVRRQAVQTELLKVLKGPEEKIDLFHAALLVSKLDNAEVDIEAYRRQLEEMAGEVKAKLPTKASDNARLDALQKYLFAENGFHGSRSDYYNRANSYMNEVLDDREGLPITLSVLFLELARRIGLDNVSGVPLPAHFMVKYTPKKGGEQIIDVWEGGKTVTRSEADEIVQATSGAPLSAEHLKPATKREIILRMLRNLNGIAERTESSADSLRYLDLILALAPDGAIDRLNRARLRLQTGDSPGAKQDLKWLLDNDPPGMDMERVTELYHSL